MFWLNYSQEEDYKSIEHLQFDNGDQLAKYSHESKCEQNLLQKIFQLNFVIQRFFQTQ